MKNLLLVFVALAAFSSCSSDDDTKTIQDVAVGGIWLEEAWQEPGGPWTVSNCNNHPSFKSFYNFKEDGTFVLTPFCDMPDIAGASGTYTVKGDVLALTSEGETFTFEVSTQGSTILYMHRFNIINNDQRDYLKKSRLVRAETF